MSRVLCFANGKISQTTASERVRGNHDIKTPLFCENRPDLIIHDSGGFETGGDDEFQKVKEIRGRNVECYRDERSAACDMVRRPRSSFKSATPIQLTTVQVVYRDEQ